MRGSDRRFVRPIAPFVVAEDSCGLADGVVKLFGCQAPYVMPREVRRITLFPLAIKTWRKLIGARPRDRPHQVFEAEAMRGEVGGQCVEQVVVRRLACPR